MSTCRIDVYGNEFDPLELLELMDVEYNMYHCNAYMIEVMESGNDLYRALSESAAIIERNLEQFRQILDGDEDASITVELNKYYISGESIPFSVSMIELMDRMSIDIRFNCFYASDKV